MAEDELRALISRAREGGGLFASDSEVLAMAAKAEELLGVVERLREQLDASNRLATALIRVGRLEAELETARERLSVEMDRFDTLAELVGECGFRLGAVELDATEFAAPGLDGEPDWARAWRETVDAHLARMESAEYLGRLTDPSGSETTEHDGPDCTDR